ncbi:hypothetical protein [Desulfitobacterium sp. AusDCA]|uniref:hypothetical protein n=1 Tax=Desulfitobacterium sp. AusDCA TaxID=3240383 RepID=UPI003DA76F68
MYFPYLRGGQFELIAIRELIEQSLIGESIIPVIEPVKLIEPIEKESQNYQLIDDYNFWFSNR